MCVCLHNNHHSGHLTLHTQTAPPLRLVVLLATLSANLSGVYPAVDSRLIKTVGPLQLFSFLPCLLKRLKVDTGDGQRGERTMG